MRALALFLLVFGSSWHAGTVRGQEDELRFSYTDPDYDLNNYLYTIPQMTANRIGSEGVQVDCLGLGMGVAKTLGHFLASNPNGTAALDVRFTLSSRRQPRRVHVMLGEQFGLEHTDFRVDRRTVVIVHGFLSNGEEEWIRSMEEAFLSWDDVNVLVVDWSAGSNTWNYYKAAVNTRVVGYQIAQLLDRIANATLGNRRENCGPLHLVGHSLGAHICGFVSKELKKQQSRWSAERISGLDPAQPCFKNADPKLKLHKTDADFVDIIHTNARLFLQIGLGLPEPIGHADFYPNGGRSQPGCVDRQPWYYRLLPIPKKTIQQAICSHGRSYVYFTESLIVASAGDNCTFWGRNWNRSYRTLLQTIPPACTDHTCSQMGVKAEEHPQRGIFFVVTSSTAPYCTNGTEINNEVRKQLEREYRREDYTTPEPSFL